MQKTSFSLEFFPPKTDKAAAVLTDTMTALAARGPKFMTVTYGAGGSTRDGTLAALKKARDAHKIPLASHLTFVNATRSELMALADTLWAENIRHIVALRGDMPGGLSWPLDPDGDYFQYTSDFVEALKARHQFEISVACYPEKHPDAPDLASDIIALKKKCDAGADRAITQFFFENETFYRFRDQCCAAGIETPIVPGLLPIHDFAGMLKFAARCQASVPAWLHEKFSGLENRPDEARAKAADLLQAQAEDLIKNGVPHIHIYTLNKAEITDQVCKIF